MINNKTIKCNNRPLLFFIMKTLKSLQFKKSNLELICQEALLNRGMGSQISNTNRNMEKRLFQKRETLNIENQDSITKTPITIFHRQEREEDKIQTWRHHMYLIVEKEVKKVQQRDHKNNYIMSKVTVIMKMNIYHRSQNNA